MMPFLPCRIDELHYPLYRAGSLLIICMVMSINCDYKPIKPQVHQCINTFQSMHRP